MDHQTMLSHILPVPPFYSSVFSLPDRCRVPLLYFLTCVTQKKIQFCTSPVLICGVLVMEQQEEKKTCLILFFIGNGSVS
jgi:hypothetical protein